MRPWLASGRPYRDGKAGLFPGVEPAKQSDRGEKAAGGYLRRPGAGLFVSSGAVEDQHPIPR